MAEEHEDDGVDAEEAYAEYLAAKKANQAALTTVAVEHGWDLEVDVYECEDCEHKEIESGWSFGIGYVFADADGFVVIYDPDMDDPESERSLTWETPELAGVLLLVDLLIEKFIDGPIGS